VRSRLIALRREREAAAGGRDLLERKREVLLRELQAHTCLRDRQRTLAAEALGEARARLADARVELGGAVVDAAALAQPPAPAVERLETRVAGVALPRLRAAPRAFAPAYGPGGTAASLDQAGAAFVAAVPPVLALASADAGVRALAAALARTVRLLNALDRIVLPEMGREIRFVEEALEEEERDERARRRRPSAAAPARR
jgi:V/A-type H+-transporting ATPase subunit D